jgi:site-specific recombinase XerD
MDTLRAATDRWLRERVLSGEITPRTRRLLEYRLAGLLERSGDRPLSDLDRRAVRAWWQSIGRLSPASRRLYRSTLVCLCRWAQEEGLLSEDPSAHLPRVREPQRVPRARPASDVARLLLGARDEREYLIVNLMVHMGLRSCEVARAEIGDYDPAAATLLVRGKGAHERVLPVPPPVAAAVSAYRDKIGGWRAGCFICDWFSGRRPITAPAVARLVNKLMRRTGVKGAPGDGITAHALRHTAASDVLDRCHDVRTVQGMLGHASLATTQIYLRRASLGQLREAMEGRNYDDAA